MARSSLLDDETDMLAGREPYAGGSIYCATKAAVRSFTDSLRKELISTRIRIIEIDPGQVETVCQSWPLAQNGPLIPCSGILRRPVLRRQVQGGRRLRVCSK